MAKGKKIIYQGIETDYLVTKEGEVFNSKTGKLLKGWVDGAGYKKFDFTYEGKKYYVPIHRAVAIAYLGYPEESLDCYHGWCTNHRDENKLNNSVENLEWVTNTENVNHSKHKYSKTWTAVSPEGVVHRFTGLPDFCKEHNLSASCLARVLSGSKEGRTQHKGWRAAEGVVYR